MIIIREASDKGMNKVIGHTFSNVVFACKSGIRVRLEVNPGKIAVSDEKDGIAVIMGKSRISLPGRAVKSGQTAEAKIRTVLEGYLMGKIKIPGVFDPSRRLSERTSVGDELEEMSTLKKADSGLPVNIRVDDTKAYIAGRHAKRIKFQGDYGNNTNRANLFTMIISKTDPKIPDDQVRKFKLPAKDISALKAVVKNNADLLDRPADEKITFGTFVK